METQIIKTGLTMASTGAAEAVFLWFLPALGGGPVMPGVRCQNAEREEGVLQGRDKAMNNPKSIGCTILQNLLILTMLSLSIQSFAKSQNQSPQYRNIKNGERVIRDLREYVAIVKVELRDQDGEEVAELTKDDFIIYEDGVEQELMYWKRNEGTDRKPDQPMYEAGYYPSNFRFRDEWRKIRVVVRGQDKRRLKVQFTPKGYYAKKELRK